MVLGTGRILLLVAARSVAPTAMATASRWWVAAGRAASVAASAAASARCLSSASSCGDGVVAARRMGTEMVPAARRAASTPMGGVQRCIPASHALWKRQRMFVSSGQPCWSSRGDDTPREDMKLGQDPDSQTSAAAKWMDSYQRHFADTEQLNQWMVRVKTDPANMGSDKVVGALMAFLLHGMFSGQNSLSSAVFWSSLLDPVGADDCTLLFTDLIQVCQSGLVPREEEQSDTFFRALFLKNDPDLDVFLRQYADDCYIGAASFQMPEEDELWKLRLESIRNMFPTTRAEQAVLRQPVTSWPLPALDMRQFRQAVLERHMTPYAYTANHFFRLREVQALAQKHSPADGSEQAALAQQPAKQEEAGNDEFAQTLYPAASSLSGCVLDALWARYYVTHDTACLDRLMEVAGAAVQHIRNELGEKKGVNRFIRALTIKDDPADTISKLCGTDREGRVVMSVGTSACLSLIENSEPLPEILDHIEERRVALHRDAETRELTLEETRARDACKLLSVVKAAKDIARLTSAQFDSLSPEQEPAQPRQDR